MALLIEGIFDGESPQIQEPLEDLGISECRDCS